VGYVWYPIKERSRDAYSGANMRMNPY